MKCLNKFTIFAAIVALIAVGSVASAGRATVVDDAIWVDGSLYGTVATDTSFNAPPSQTTDTIYSFSMSGLQGQRSIAEAAPGDRDYNGGRWDVKMVVFTALGLSVHDADGDGMVDGEIMSDGELLNEWALGNVEIFDTGFYFECPLRPSH